MTPYSRKRTAPPGAPLARPLLDALLILGQTHTHLQLAGVLGVSLDTVRRALRGEPLKQSTRVKIEQALKEEL